MERAPRRGALLSLNCVRRLDTCARHNGSTCVGASLRASRRVANSTNHADYFREECSAQRPDIVLQLPAGRFLCEGVGCSPPHQRVPSEALDFLAVRGGSDRLSTPAFGRIVAPMVTSQRKGVVAVVSAVFVWLAGCFSPNTEAMTDLGTAGESEPELESNTSSGQAAGSTSLEGTGSSSFGTTSSATTSGTGPDGGSDEGSGGTGASSSTGEISEGSSTGDPTATMLCQSLCVPAAPEGWSGPFVRAQDPGTEEKSGCSGGYPSSVWLGFGAVVADAAECECSCGAPSGGSCEDELTVHIYDRDQNGFNCLNLTGTVTTANNYVDDNGSGINLRIDEPEVEDAPTCDPSESESLPTVETSEAVELCSGQMEDGECAEGELCVSEFSSGVIASHCIWAEGESLCPAGSVYSEQTVYFESFSDSRSCSSCSCGAAQNTDCDGVIPITALYTTAEGSGTIDPAENELANGSCRSVIPNEPVHPDSMVAYGLLGYVPEVPTSSGCDPIGGNPQGAVSGTNPVTVCCTP